jgi:uncharacterized protein YjbJ (UPF0337 family)
MGITDKITGRVKQAAGDLTGDERLREEGLSEERKGDAKEEAAKADLRAEKEREKADELRREAARLETSGRSDGGAADRADRAEGNDRV